MKLIPALSSRIERGTIIYDAYQSWVLAALNCLWARMRRIR